MIAAQQRSAHAAALVLVDAIPTNGATSDTHEAVNTLLKEVPLALFFFFSTGGQNTTAGDVAH